MKSFYYFMILFVFLFVTSCNNTSSPESTDNNNNILSTYFPVTIGSWWVYKTLVDKENNTYTYDSMVVVANVSKYDRECQMFVTFHNSEGFTYSDTSYFFTDKSKVYYLMSGSNSDKLAWYEFIDFDADNLVILENNIVDVEIAPDSIFTGVEKLVRYKEKKETIVVNGNSIDCIKFKVSNTYDGVIKNNDGESSEFKKDMFTFYYWYGDNVGLVKTVYGDLEYISDLQNYSIVK